MLLSFQEILGVKNQQLYDNVFIKCNRLRKTYDKAQENKKNKISFLGSIQYVNRKNEWKRNDDETKLVSFLSFLTNYF